MTQSLRFAVFFAGLAVIGWVGAGYLGTSLLALSVTLLIAGVYAVGALELHRFHQATAALAQAVAALPDPMPALQPWLAGLPASLQPAVRRRVAGEPVGLPGPALAPYLAGFLVLLGMLGTFLGMVLTLRGTGAALETAADLEAVRHSLVEPVKGLGLAFGTSIAGVAASAALGLMAALCRRERVKAAQALDGRIATTLRPFGTAHQQAAERELQREQQRDLQRQQHEASVLWLQRQAEQMPALVDKLQAMMTLIEQQAGQTQRQLLDSQAHFQAKAEAAYTGLAASVDRSLQASLTDSARAASATIQPVVEATLAGIARETAALHATLAGTVQQQADHLAERLEANTTRVAETWQAALARHERSSEGLSAELRTLLEGFSTGFDERAAALLDTVTQQQAGTQQTLAATLARLGDEHAARQAGLADTLATQLDGVSTRLDSTAQRVTEGWQAALQRHTQAAETTAQLTQQALGAATERFEQGTAAMLARVATAQAEAQAAAAQASAELARTHATQQERLAGELASRLDGVGERLDRTAQQVTEGWQGALAEHRRLGESTARESQAALGAAAAQFEQHAATLLQTAEAARAAQQAAATGQDQQRLAAMSQSLEALATSLQQAWQAAGEQTLTQQQRISETMERTAREITAQAESHATHTIAEIARLVQAASEAPRAAAEVIGELRQKLSDSMTRDNALLDERARILDTLNTLLDGVTQAATEQRGAIDALVNASATLLERVGMQFTSQVEAETGKLAEVAAQVTGSAAEVASLGDAFGHGVQLFSESNDKLVAQLQRIDTALGKSLSRSDEQLAYYVAQAREVIDLSILSQKQIIEDLQRVAGQAAPAPAATPAPAMVPAK